MNIELEEDDVVALTQIVDETYAGLLLERQMQSRGQKTDVPKEVLPDLLFNTARLLLKLSKTVHANHLCGCEDDLNIIRQELVFRETFKKEIALREWWGKRFSDSHQLQIASPQSPTSDPQSHQGEPKPQSGQGTQSA